MNLEAYIKGLILDGKSSQEIATLVSDEYPKAGVDEILNAIKTAKQSEAKASQVGLAMLKEDLKDDLKKEINQQIEDSLKTIQVNINEFKLKKSEREFDFMKGEYVEVTEQKAEAYSKMHLLLDAVYEKKDLASATSISKEIELDNTNSKIMIERNGVKLPAVSDVQGQGGYAIPTILREEIFQLQYASTPIMRLMSVDQISGSNTQDVPVMNPVTITPIADQNTQITEKTPQFNASRVSMYRFGGFTYVSNDLLQLKPNIVRDFVAAYASASARAVEMYALTGAGSADLITGIAFDSNTSRPSSYALSALDIPKISDLMLLLNDEASANNLAFVGNRKVQNKIGLLEHSSNYVFPTYIGGGNFSPMGIPFVVCPKIQNTLNFTTPSRTTGTSTALIIADFSAISLLMSNARFDIGDEMLKDQKIFRVVQKFGVKVLSGASSAGVVCVAQELTGAS